MPSTVCGLYFPGNALTFDSSSHVHSTSDLNIIGGDARKQHNLQGSLVQGGYYLLRPHPSHLRRFSKVLCKVDLYRLSIHELKLEHQPECCLSRLPVSDDHCLYGRIQEHVGSHWSTTDPLRPPGCGPDSEPFWAELDRRCESQHKSCIFRCLFAQ